MSSERGVYFGGAFLVALFQLVGRSQAERLIGVEATGWYLELRLWALAAMSIWLIAMGALTGRRQHTHGAGHCRDMIIVFIVYMIVTSLWAPDPIRAAGKAYELFFVIWACTLLVGTLRIAGVRTTIEGFWVGLFAGALALAAIGLVTAVASSQAGERLSVLSGGPNVFGRNMGLLTLVSVHLIVARRALLQMIGMVTAPVAALLVLLSGSRGAMLSLFLGLVVYLSVHGIDRRVLLRLVAVGMVAVLVLLTRFGELALLVFRDRFVVLLLSERYFTHRDVLLLEGLAAGVANPLAGLGLTGFAGVGTHGSHPHNIFVEAFAEGGIPGLALLCLPFLRYLIRSKKCTDLGDALTVSGLALVTMSSSISGDLFDARGVFLLLLLSVASQTRPKTSTLDHVR